MGPERAVAVDKYSLYRGDVNSGLTVLGVFQTIREGVIFNLAIDHADGKQLVFLGTRKFSAECNGEPSLSVH